MLCAGFRRLGAVFVVFLATPLAGAVAKPSYTGTYVVVNPYNTSDMHFLQCAANLTPEPSCKTLAPSKSGFQNPFTSGTATGIVLRLPWCGFQIGPAAGQAVVNGSGECHLRVQGEKGAGKYVAGSFSGSGATQFRGQSLVDLAISNLSLCASTTYDTCKSSVLGTALGYLAQINAVASQPLVMSLAIEAGEYTPRSVLAATGGAYVGYVDLPEHQNKSKTGAATTQCTRQPLAWQTSFVHDYTAMLSALLIYMHTTGLDLPALSIIKPAAFVSNSAEFDVAARTGVLATAFDPSGTGNSLGPQGDTVVQCPDHTVAQNGVAALLTAWQAHGNAQATMVNAYEGAFGAVAGFANALLAQYATPDAILSVPTKGEEAFAHVQCGLDGNSPCVADPSPSAFYDWSEYYFTKFINDLFVPGSVAYTNAVSAYQTACAGTSCAGGHFALTPWQLALVFTGLDPTQPSALMTGLPSCWLNNTKGGSIHTTPATLLLYFTPAPHPTTTSYVVVGPPPVGSAPGGGTMSGWQTLTSSGSNCMTGQYSLHGATANGGQFVEIQTDAASEPSCVSPLRSALNKLDAPNPTVACLYN
jgi:hypothetical protein